MESCILFDGAKDDNGYGRKWHNTKMVLAHRLALAEHEGIDIPPASVLCLHSCNNPPCINPEHLRWGTVTDNMQDAVKSGRARQNYMANAKLDAVKVLEIRTRYAEGNCTQQQLADIYGVSRGRISHIVTGHGWKWSS